MNEARRNEIAYKLLQFCIRNKGIHLTRDIIDEIEKASKVLEISVEELKEFLRGLIEDFIQANLQ